MVEGGRGDGSIGGADHGGGWEVMRRVVVLAECVGVVGGAGRGDARTYHAWRRVANTGWVGGWVLPSCRRQ